MSKVMLLCNLGYVELRKGWGWQYAVLSPEDDYETMFEDDLRALDHRCFKKRLCNVGSLVEVHGDNDSIQPSTAKYVGHLNHYTREQLQLRSKAAEVEKKVIAEQHKKDSEFVADSGIIRWRGIYRGLHWSKRACFLGWLINEITK